MRRRCTSVSFVTLNPTSAEIVQRPVPWGPSLNLRRGRKRPVSAGSAASADHGSGSSNDKNSDDDALTHARAAAAAVFQQLDDSLFDGCDQDLVVFDARGEGRGSGTTQGPRGDFPSRTLPVDEAAAVGNERNPRHQAVRVTPETSARPLSNRGGGPFPGAPWRGISRERKDRGVTGVGRGTGRGRGRGRGRSGGTGRGGDVDARRRRRDLRRLVEDVKEASARGDWEEALKQVAGARASGLELDGRSHTAAVHAALEGGVARSVLKAVADMRADGCVPNASLYNKAISLCGRKGAWKDALFLLRDAQKVSPAVSVVTYSAAVAACRNGGEWQQALALMEEMQAAGIQADQIAYGTAVSACAMGGRWRQAVALLQDMRRAGLRPDVIAYSSAIKACGSEGRWQEALDLLEEMRENGVRPNLITYTGAMEACGRAGQWNSALRLLAEVRDRGLTPDAFTLNAVMDALGRSGETEKALALLATMRPPRPPPPRIPSARPPGSLTTPAAVASGFRGTPLEATLAADAVKTNGFRGVRAGDGAEGGPSNRASSVAGRGGKARGPVADVFTWSAAMTACIEGGQWHKVAGILEEMRGDGVEPNVINYNLAVRALGRGGEWRRATGLLAEMAEAGVRPDERTFNAAIEACGRGGCWERAVSLMDDMRQQGLVPDGLTYSTVIAACDRSEAWDIALMMLDEARRGTEGGGGGKKANVFSFTAAISACGKSGHWQEAVRLLDLMRKDGIPPNEVTLRTVLLALENAPPPPQPPPKEGRGRSPGIPGVDRNAPDSHGLGIPEGVVPGSSEQQEQSQPGRYAESPHGLPWEVARSLLESMARAGGEGSGQAEEDQEGRERFFPGPRDFAAGLTAACFGGAEWSSIVQILDLMHSCAASAEPTRDKGADTESAAVMPGKAGKEWGGEGGTTGLVQAYNHVIRVCGDAGGTELALALLDEMHRRGVTPDAASYSGAIIACDLAGMWREAVGLLDDMRQKAGTEPDLVCYNCAIKACGSSGELEQALRVMETMRARGVAPDEVTYSSAITACGNAGEAKRAIALLQAMKDDGVAAGLFAHNAAIGACDKGGEWSLALSVLKEMRAAEVRPDAISYAGAISSCDRAGEWRLTLGLYDQMRADMAADAAPSASNSTSPNKRGGSWGPESITREYSRDRREVGGAGMGLPPPRTTVAALTACARGGQWEKAVGILRDVQAAATNSAAAAAAAAAASTGPLGLEREDDRVLNGGGGSSGARDGVRMYLGQASSLAFNAALVACAKGAEREAREGRECGWREALEILDMVGPAPDLMGYGLAITACGFAGNVEACVGLLSEMLRRDMTPTLADYHGSLRACASRKRGDAAQEILDSMASEGVEPDARCYRFAAEAFKKTGEDDQASPPEARRFSEIARGLESAGGGVGVGGGGSDGNDSDGGGLGEVLKGMGMSGTEGLDVLLEGARRADFEALGSDEVARKN